MERKVRKPRTKSSPDVEDVVVEEQPRLLAFERVILDDQSDGPSEVFVAKVEEGLYEFEGRNLYPDSTGRLFWADLGDYSGMSLVNFINLDLEPPVTEMPWGGDFPAVQSRRGNVLLRDLGDGRFETAELDIIVVDPNTYPDLFCRFEESGLPAPYAIGPNVNPYDYRFLQWA